MSKSTPKASVITTEQVLEAARYLNAKELRAYQSKLTATSKELIRLADKNMIGSLISLEERQVLRDAAALVKSINTRVEHAKEKKQRDENALSARYKARDREAHAIVSRKFLLPTDTLEQQVEIVRFALVLNQANILHSFYSPSEFTAKLVADATDKQVLPHWRPLHKIQYLRRQIHEALQERIAEGDSDIPANLEKIEACCTSISDIALKQQYVAAAVSAWEQALSAQQGGEH